MTKMDMVWIAVAKMLHPRTETNTIVSKTQIDDEVMALFGESITPVMIQKHLVNSVDRMADKDQPQRGGSRNRYLVREADGFRLYKRSDDGTDAWDKTGPTHPSREKVDHQFVNLVDWYESQYF